MALEERNIILPGGNTCPGCAGPTVHKIIYNVLGQNVIQFGGGGCGGGSPRTVPTYSLHHSGVASGATGIIEALKAQGRTDITVIGMAGDGGTQRLPRKVTPNVLKHLGVLELHRPHPKAKAKFFLPQLSEACPDLDVVPIANLFRFHHFLTLKPSPELALTNDEPRGHG